MNKSLKKLIDSLSQRVKKLKVYEHELMKISKEGKEVSIERKSENISN